MFSQSCLNYCVAHCSVSVAQIQSLSCKDGHGHESDSQARAVLRSLYPVGLSGTVSPLLLLLFWRALDRFRRRGQPRYCCLCMIPLLCFRLRLPCDRSNSCEAGEWSKAKVNEGTTSVYERSVGIDLVSNFDPAQSHPSFHWLNTAQTARRGVCNSRVAPQTNRIKQQYRDQDMHSTLNIGRINNTHRAEA